MAAVKNWKYCKNDENRSSTKKVQNLHQMKFQFFPVKGNNDVRLLAKFENNPITNEEFRAERTFGPKKGPST